MKKNNAPRTRSTCSRKERRYRTTDAGILRSETSKREGGSAHGTVLDISRTGLRLICDGRFSVNQTMYTELTTNRSQGIYRGIIRRVEPWTGEQSILGCSLNDPIPDEVLQELAIEGVVDRRSDERFDVTQDATVFWPLCQQEFGIEVQDHSISGMRFISPVTIPDDVRLRFRIGVGDEKVVVEAKSMWRRESEECCEMGVAFTQKDAATKVAKAFGNDSTGEVGVPERNCSARVQRGFTIAACALVLCCVLMQLF